MFAKFAKVPVLDPMSPTEAVEMIEAGFRLSEKHRIPVILRPSLRVCHAKEAVVYGETHRRERNAEFRKDSGRWAATPRDRFRLHGELNRKLAAIAEEASEFNFEVPGEGDKAVIAAGVEYAAVLDYLADRGIEGKVPLLKVGMASPLQARSLDRFVERFARVLVLEDPDTTIEEQITLRDKISGRLDGFLPSEGELTGEVVYQALDEFLFGARQPESTSLQEAVQALGLPVRRPTLCAGCPHRASFWSVRRAFPKGIYPSDIGCYTLGKNLHAVDTCLDMGAAINMASGFYRSFWQDGVEKPVIATIGDSTFFHSGIPGLANAVYTDCRYVLVILDNGTVAMTGMQPAPTTGVLADGRVGKRLSLEDTVTGVGVKHLQVVDPYDTALMRQKLAEAYAFTKAPDGGMAVLIARHPCLLNDRSAVPDAKSLRLSVTDDCNACRYCVDHFECPALVLAEGAERVTVDDALCVRCGVCETICPRNALRLEEVRS